MHGPGQDSNAYTTDLVGVPATPGAPSATPGATLAYLAWQPAAGAARYDIQILDSAGAAIGALPTVSTCQAVDTPAGCTAAADIDGGGKAASLPLAAFGDNRGTYRFRLRGISAGGVAGDWSGASAAAVVGGPGAVGQVAVTGSGSGLTVEWEPVDLAEDGYEVELLDAQGNVAATVTIPKAQLPTVSAGACAR